MNLEVPETLNSGVLDSNTMTVLESMAPSNEHHPEPMVIYVQSNSHQVDGQMLSLNEDPLVFPEVGPLESLGNPGEQIVTLVDDLGQALEGQAVPITLSDIGNIDFVDGAGAAFQTEDGQVLYLTYTVDHGSGENQLNDGVTLQANGEVDMLAGLNIPGSHQPQQIVLDVSPANGNYIMSSDANNTNTLMPDNSVPLLSIPESKKSSSGKKDNSKTSKRNAVDHRKTARVIGPEVHIEDKLQVLEAMVPRVERPKKKKPEPKSVKQKTPLEERVEQVEKKDCKEKSEEQAVNEETDQKMEEPQKDEKPKGEKEDSLYICDLCGNAYARAAQYYGHLHTHSGERDWNCHLCGEVFKSHSQLRRHESRSHLNMRPYPCSVCGNRFDRASQLKYHERRIHAGEKPHRCLICSKGFFKRSDLRTHVNIHLGINKSICETCGKQFNHVSNLIRHTRVHTGIKPYPCNVCGRRFSQVNALQHHKDSHNTTREFSCTICHKQFKSSFMLKKHMRSSHADSLSLSQKEEKYVGQNRRYYCNVCGENFAFSVMLKDHESKHQKETNFHCNCCGNNYKSADEFKVHSCNETEDSKSKEDDSSVKKEVKNYGDFMNRIAKVVHNKVEDSSDIQEGGNEHVVISGDHNVQEPEASLMQNQSLMLGMGESSSIKSEVVEMNKLADIKEENEGAKLNGTNKTPEICGGFKILRPGDIDSTWIVDSNVISCEPNSEGKWMTMPQQEESEIVIYVTPDLHHDVDVKKVTLPSSAPSFKKEDIYLNNGMQRNSANLSITAPVLDDDGCINVQVQDTTDTADDLPSQPNSLADSEPMEDPFADIPNEDEKKVTELAMDQPAKEKGKPLPKTFKCKECGKIFYKNSNYKQHLGIHFVDLQRYQCKLCGRSFAWKSTLNKHMTNSHQTGPTPKFSCGFCAKEYATSSQVQEHIKRDHYKERPHTCDVCNKTFYKKYDLKIHLRTHTKEKPYICGACGKAFYHLSHIIRHERIHTGERPYKCDDCGREFNQSSSLKTHKIRHSNCSASANKMDASAKVLISDENLTMLNSLPETMAKNRSPKKTAGAHSEPEINIDILSSKDANLSFESIPSYEENGITS